MPKTITVYKNGDTIKNVYPCELQAWLDDGATIEPIATPEPKPANRRAKKED
jgi:hypothetical protein